MKKLTWKHAAALCLCGAMLLSAACGDAPAEEDPDTVAEQQPAENKEIPSQSQLADLLEEQGLDWSISDSHIEANSSAYACGVPEYNRLIGLQVQREENREMALISAQILNSEEDTLDDSGLRPQLYALADALYEGGQGAVLFPEMEAELTAEDWTFSFNPTATRREGDLCYCLNMVWQEGAYAFSNLRILNSAAYERIQSQALETVRAGYGGLATLSVKEAADTPRGEDNVYVLVKGKLEKAKPAGEGYPANWQIVELTDGESSMEVLLQPHCFSEEELAAERSHIVCFQQDLTLPLLLCSTISD